MIKAAIFDVDDTLYSFTETNKTAFTVLSAFVQETLGWSEAFFRQQHDATMQELFKIMGNTAAAHNRLIRYQHLLERNGLPVKYAPQMAELYWNTLIGAAEPYPGLLDAVNTLRGRRLRLGIGTNMTAAMQFKKLERLGLLPLLDFVVTSEEALIDKPGKAFFELCVQKSGCKPEECLFMGDSRTFDVDGALNAGLNAVWFNQAGAPPDYPAAIASWQELPGYIERLGTAPRHAQ